MTRRVFSNWFRHIPIYTHRCRATQFRSYSCQTNMAEYDSGDDLFDDVNPDDLVSNGKRPISPSEASSVKRAKVGASDTLTLARRILHDKFRFDDFRHEQARAIESVIDGQNTLVIFPTGAGKSLCYQIPAIAFEEIDRENGGRKEGSGITIVVSPLIALMKDQTDALKRRGIAAECSDSTKTYEEQQKISADMRAGRLRLLYCSPEKVNNEGFVQTMKHVPGGVRLVAVDEAHCISEWGHSFRPEYLKVARFTQEIKAERVICLTATATPKVADDVCKTFDIQPSKVYRTSPYRPNLKLEAEPIRTKQDAYPKLFNFLRSHPGPTLVYVTLQKQAEALADDFQAQGFKATAFHAGLDTNRKTTIQNAFMSGKIPIIVATIAFGMGIDKADIRNIVHFNIPSTIEEYSQQIGRAGRDGLQSHCMLYLCPEDFWQRESFVRGDLPSRQSVFSLLLDIFQRDIKHTPEGEIIQLNANELSRVHDIRLSPLSILFATLELRFNLMRAITPEYTKYQFIATPKYNREATMDKSREAQAIFTYAKKAVKWYNFDMSATITKTHLPRADFLRKLNAWHNEGIIQLKPSGMENRFRVLKELPSTHEEINDLVDKLYADMQSREKDGLRRAQQVMEMITGDKCFAFALASYFGMGLPDGKTECGHCTICCTKKRVVLPHVPKPSLNPATIEQVLAACDVRDDPRFLTRVAFGVQSPRVSQLKLNKSPVFGLLQDQEFEPVLEEFTKACKAAESK